jgi:hypothetical protein
MHKKKKKKEKDHLTDHSVILVHILKVNNWNKKFNVPPLSEDFHS